MNVLHFLVVLGAFTTSVLIAKPTVSKPDFSEFSVVFPDKPEEKLSSFVGIGGGTGESMNAVLASEDGFFRAEFLPVPNPADLASMTDEEIRQKCLMLGKHNGLVISDLTVSRKDDVRIAKLRGTKILKRNGKEAPVTYEMAAYYGRTSIMSLTVGAPSEAYPTEAISRFLTSVKKH